MNRRLLTWAGLAAAIAMVAQIAHTAGGALTTSWGEPDLQGLWADEDQVRFASLDRQP